MKKVLFMLMGIMLVFGTVAYAVPTTDTLEYPSGFFAPSATTSSPYYRWWNEDWGWQHNAISGFTSGTGSLYVSAYDVDAPDEVDIISAYNGSSWVDLGSLLGGNNIWGYTTFLLNSSWDTAIQAGLQVKIDIDSTHTSNFWAVTLAKSVLTVDGGTPPNPNPGAVPEPATLLLLGSGLVGLVGFGRKKFRK